MIELERHIEVLLLSNDCVIVPDLGGFMAHHLEARYDEREAMFLPPQRTLGFNPQLKLNDSLLAQSYVEAYDISYPEALRRIEAEVAELRQHLDNEGFYEMNDIGRLFVNPEGNLEFSPCDAGILTPELYGLSSFEFAPLGSAAGKKAVVQPIHNKEKEKKPASSSSAVLPETPTPTLPETEQAITIKMTWIRNAVAIAAAILAFFFMTKPMTEGVQSGLTLSKMSLPIIQQPAPQQPLPVSTECESAPTVETAHAQSAATPADASADASADEPTTADTPLPSYCIVAAAHVSKKGADEFVQKLQKRGYASARVLLNNSVRRVVLGNFTTEAEAYALLNKLHSDHDLAEAWVYKLNNQQP